MAAIVLRLAPNLAATFGGLQIIAHALPAFEAILSLEAELRPARGPAEAKPSVSDHETPLRATTLRINDAGVYVPDNDGGAVRLIHCQDIEIPPGSLVHVSGPSGAGKSTFVELVAGLYLPGSGSVRLGDMQLGVSTHRAWQAEVSFAPQEPFLFDDSVRANLLWPDLQRQDADILAVLEICAAADLVLGLPNGLDHRLLEGGARLSGGERQRLCLARALLRPASILILDEATSAMDPELERQVVARLRETVGNGIILLVSHSRNTAQLADIAIRVENGRAGYANDD